MRNRTEDRSDRRGSLTLPQQQPWMRSNRIAHAVSALTIATALLLGACGSSGGKQLSTKDFCQEVNDSSKANKAIGEELRKAKTIGALRSAYSKARARIDKLADQAPDKIKGDVKTLADSFDKLTDAANKAKSPADFRTRGLKIGLDKDTQAASQRVDTWQQKNCKKNK